MVNPLAPLGEDKVMHYGLNYIISDILFHWTTIPVWGILLSIIIIGFIKEFVDIYYKGRLSWGDMAANVLGCITQLLVNSVWFF